MLSEAPAVAFPVGGIGTGTVSITGTGDLANFEFWNRPARGVSLPYTFVTLRAQEAGQPAVLRVARSWAPAGGPDDGGRLRGAGFPHMQSARFEGAYPFCWVAFEDAQFPVQVQLEAWNPMIPLAVDDSSLPVAVLTYTLHNPSSRTVDVSLAFSTVNPVGHDWKTQVNPVHAAFGGNVIEVERFEAAKGSPLVGLVCRTRPAKGTVNDGSLALAAFGDRVETARYGPRTWGECTNQLFHYGAHLLETGRLLPGETTLPTPEGVTCWGALAPHVQLAPGATRSVTFLLAWHFPRRVNDWHAYPEVQGAVLRNDYGRRFPDAWGVVKHVALEWERLYQQTRSFQEALFDSTLPGPLVDAVSSQMALLRTSTCMLIDDDDNGRTLYAFEGSNDHAGSFPLNCTHVWNYAQAVAYLYPELERSARRVDFRWNLFPDGSMAFRTIVPLGRRLWDWYASADGQLGTIVRLYREWQLCADRAFLRELWPFACKAMEYVWVNWDADRDGVIEGEQHNTYDVEFYGPNTMIGTLYLAALQAMAKMAEALGDEAWASRCRDLADRGRAGHERLWNGEYFVQRVPPAHAIAAPATSGANENDPPLRAIVAGEVRHQVGEGCLSDQLVGQWLATQLGLGHLLDPDKVRKALASIVRHNFKRDLREHLSSDRIYARGRDRALLNCTWPRGGRPAWPVLYADEAWTGVEYQVAAHLLFEGHVREAVEVVAAVRARHDGVQRNPWDDQEAGHNYARALSSFSLLLAGAGMSCSVPEGRLGFCPRFSPEAFESFFSSGVAWGRYRQSARRGQLSVSLQIEGGVLQLRVLDLPPLGEGTPATIRAEARTPGAAARGLAATLTRESGMTRVTFASPCRLEAGSALFIFVGDREAPR